LLLAVLFVLVALAALAPVATVDAASAARQGEPVFASSDRLNKLARDAADAAVKEFGGGGLTPDKIALTILDLSDRDHPVRASYRGEQPVYPASVVKMFYLAAAHRMMEGGKLKSSAELERAMRDMIVDSSNDATHYVLDAVTGTTGGPELEEDALRQWMDKRNAVNRYFSSLGYKNINVNQKTWCEAPYGRERQGYGPNFENRNRLTTEAVARLTYEIATGGAVSRERSRAMMSLMRRDTFSKSSDPDDQATAFAGKALPAGSEYYSKAGYTSTTRHDAAYIRLPNGAEYVLVVFTLDNSKQPGIIPFVSRLVAEDFMKTASPKKSADLYNRRGRVAYGK
jgi:beta-lactamase class A